MSGTPTNTVLNGAVVVTATDNFGCQGTRNTTITVRPTTDNENYTGGVGHTQYVTGAPFPSTPHVAFVDNVKTGDNGPAPLSVTFPATSTNGGTIVEGTTDGTFIYTPAVDFARPVRHLHLHVDRRQRRDQHRHGDDQPVEHRLVCEQQPAAPATAGRTVRSTRLNAAATPSGSTHIIYVHSGGATTTGNLAMDANQTLQGQGATFTLNGLTIPAGTRPTLTGTVTLADNTTVRAVNFTPSGIPAMAASAVSFAQPVTIDQVNVTGGTSALSLTNVTATATGAINVSNADLHQHERCRSADLPGHHPGDARRHGDHQQQRRPIDRHPEPHRRHGHLQRRDHRYRPGRVPEREHRDRPSTSPAVCRSARRTNPGFTATGGGTVSATQNNTTIVNTITTTTGTALNVANTTIGASGLTFRSISAGTGVSGPAKGIILNVTGAGAFTVTGTGGGRQWRHDSEREQPRRRVHIREQRDVERHGLQQQRDRRRGRQLR